MKAAYGKGVPLTIEHRKKISEVYFNKWQDPVYRAKQMERQKAIGLRNYPKKEL